ncbi:hypothetical protein B0H10DRAFT_1954726 [Mycena sp. CBHHK59/15]|nr:hypothetical protein B0H10DRAFT_1954726 [Mycena sp. CBHHK59/15]
MEVESLGGMEDSELQDSSQCKDLSVLEEMIDQHVNSIITALRTFSDYHTWPKDMVEKVKAITFKFDQELFITAKTESTSKSQNTEADSFLKQNDAVLKLTKVIGDLSAQVSAMQQRMEEPSKQHTEEPSNNQPKSSGPEETHTTGPVYKPTTAKAKKSQNTVVNSNRKAKRTAIAVPPLPSHHQSEGPPVGGWGSFGMGSGADYQQTTVTVQKFEAPSGSVAAS